MFWQCFLSRETLCHTYNSQWVMLRMPRLNLTDKDGSFDKGGPSYLASWTNETDFDHICIHMLKFIVSWIVTYLCIFAVSKVVIIEMGMFWKMLNSYLIWTFLDIDDCPGNGCLQGSTCVDGLNSYTCLCRPGFSGDYCQICPVMKKGPNCDQGELISVNVLIFYCYQVVYYPRCTR